MRIRLSRPIGAHTEDWRWDHEHTEDEGILSEGVRVDSKERRDERTLKVKLNCFTISKSSGVDLCTGSFLVGDAKSSLRIFNHTRLYVILTLNFTFYVAECSKLSCVR